jgi:hypothetical protein
MLKPSVSRILLNLDIASGCVNTNPYSNARGHYKGCLATLRSVSNGAQQILVLFRRATRKAVRTRRPVPHKAHPILLLMKLSVRGTGPDPHERRLVSEASMRLLRVFVAPAVLIASVHRRAKRAL